MLTRHGLTPPIGLVVMITTALTTASSPLTFGRDYRFAPMRSLSPIRRLAGGAPATPSKSARSISFNSTYTVYTGLADSSAQFYLTDASPAVRDDVVQFNNGEEPINDYLNIFGLPLTGQRRFVTETMTSNADGSKTDVIVIRCVDATGAPADLWPGGLAYNGVPLPNGSLGLGLTLPDELGGSGPVAVQPGTTITGLSVQVMSDGILGGVVDLPLDSFIFPSPSNWDGTLGLMAIEAADTSAVDSRIVLRITSTLAPEPTAVGAAMTATVALASASRRRRRR